jgi:hypothetical protein
MRRFEIAAWIITGALLIAVLPLRLLPALLAGLLVYELVHVISPRLPYVSGSRGKIAAVTLLSVAIVGVLVLAIVGIIAFMRSDAGSLPGLLQKMADILENARGKLPEWMVANLPPDADAMKNTVSEWLRENSKELAVVGGEVGHAPRAHAHRHGDRRDGLATRSAPPRGSDGSRSPRRCSSAPSASAKRSARRLRAGAHLGAQHLLHRDLPPRRSCPMFGVHLPFAKTLVAVTFLAGLLPVSGNLISNTVIVVVSLNVSLEVAGRFARLPRHHPQARVLPQRAHRRRPDPREGVGASCSRCW